MELKPMSLKQPEAKRPEPIDPPAVPVRPEPTAAPANPHDTWVAGFQASEAKTQAVIDAQHQRMLALSIGIRRKSAPL